MVGQVAQHVHIRNLARVHHGVKAVLFPLAGIERLFRAAAAHDRVNVHAAERGPGALVVAPHADGKDVFECAPVRVDPARPRRVLYFEPHDYELFRFQRLAQFHPRNGVARARQRIARPVLFHNRVVFDHYICHLERAIGLVAHVDLEFLHARQHTDERVEDRVPVEDGLETQRGPPGTVHVGETEFGPRSEVFRDRVYFEHPKPARRKPLPVEPVPGNEVIQQPVRLVLPVHVPIPKVNRFLRAIAEIEIEQAALVREFVFGFRHAFPFPLCRTVVHILHAQLLRTACRVIPADLRGLPQCRAPGQHARQQSHAESNSQTHTRSSLFQ